MTETIESHTGLLTSPTVIGRKDGLDNITYPFQIGKEREGGRGLPFRTSALSWEGGTFKSRPDIVSNLSKRGCVNLQTRGDGVKKSEIFADVLNGSPLGTDTRTAALFFFAICFQFQRLD